MEYTYSDFIGYIQETLTTNWDLDALTDYEGTTLQYKDVARKIEKLHILFENASCNNCYCLGAWLFDSTHCHTHMLCLHHHHNTLWLQMFHNGICNLSRHLFLNLWTFRKYFYCPCKFTESNHFAIRNISYMCFPVKRHKMMFTHRVENNILFQYHLIAVYMKGFGKMYCCILIHS